MKLQECHIVSGGKATPVKNLGWLLRHWQEVERFEVVRVEPITGPGWYECILTAYLKPSGKVEKYVTPFASASILKRWLARPVFIGLPVNWFGVERTIEEADKAEG